MTSMGLLNHIDLSLEDKPIHKLSGLRNKPFESLNMGVSISKFVLGIPPTMANTGQL